MNGANAPSTAARFVHRLCIAEDIPVNVQNQTSCYNIFELYCQLFKVRYDEFRTRIGPDDEHITVYIMFDHR